jgi:hypothetical protein
MIQDLCSALALTTTSTAATKTSVTGGYNYHTLDFQWTPGTAGNVLTVIVEHRVPAVTNGEWTQQMKWNENPSGTLTRVLLQYQHTATGTAVVPLSASFEGHGGEFRIKVSESEAGSSTKGTLTAWLTSSMS